MSPVFSLSLPGIIYSPMQTAYTPETTSCELLVTTSTSADLKTTVASLKRLKCARRNFQHSSLTSSSTRTKMKTIQISLFIGKAYSRLRQMTAHALSGTQNSGRDSTVLPILNGRLVAAMRVHHATQMRPPVIKTSELVLGNRPGAVSIRKLIQNATIL